MNEKKVSGLIILQSPLLLKYPELSHGISTRQGGVSQGLYQSLNLSLWVGDEAECVLDNRRRFCQALGVSVDSLTMARQVHGCEVKVIRQGEGGQGGCDGARVVPETDAMLTNEKGISLLAYSADCPLILCYDPVKQVIGTIHASWRGASEGIISKAIQRMQEEFGSKPAEIIAAISPCIGPCCYEVKEDFIEVMTKRIPAAQEFASQRATKTYFDLWAFTIDQLKRSGLRPEHIEGASLCTRCNPGLFYSWRRDGAGTGRFGALISLV